MRTIIFSLVLIIISCNKVFPQTDPESGISDPALLESFLDGMMNDHLKSKHIAGAVVAVVKDGNIHLKKGYGYSDYENKGPVSPDSTLFRIGSIVKSLENFSSKLSNRLASISEGDPTGSDANQPN